MSEETPPIALPQGDDQKTVVTLDWEGDEVRWVTVEPDWAEHVSPASLLAQTCLAYQKAQPPAESWRLEVNLGDVALEDLREFRLLLSEARASDPVVHGEPVELKTQHLESTWSHAGYLMRLSDPRAWLATATRQAVCEELTAVLQRPEECQKKTETREVRRLMDFVGKGKN